MSATTPEIRVRVLYWLDMRGAVWVWFGDKGRPAGSVDVVSDRRPVRVGELFWGTRIPCDKDSYETARHRVLVVGMPEP